VRKQAKKWRNLKWLISVKLYFHHDAHVEIRLWGEYRLRRWRKNGQGGQNTIFNILAFYRRNFIFAYLAKFNNKTVHLWYENPHFRMRVSRATIYYNFKSWSSLCSELWSSIVWPSEKTGQKVKKHEVVDFSKIILSSRYACRD
jgi:hypothetical protein